MILYVQTKICLLILYGWDKYCHWFNSALPVYLSRYKCTINLFKFMNTNFRDWGILHFHWYIKLWIPCYSLYIYKWLQALLEFLILWFNTLHVMIHEHLYTMNKNESTVCDINVMEINVVTLKLIVLWFSHMWNLYVEAVILLHMYLYAYNQHISWLKLLVWFLLIQLCDKVY